MKFVEGHTVGIDLGTTFSCIAKLDDDGNPVPIANEDDEVETPSLVLLAEGGHVVVGPSRMRAAMEDPDRVIERIKREMGNSEYKRVFEGQELTPEFISALILKKLHQDAQKRIGKIGNAVITVPYYFNDARRKATQDAGRIAGLNVIDIINEPTAATLTYAWNQGELGTASDPEAKPRMAMVYDLGGGTFDVTLVRYTPTHFEVLATDGDVHLGGVDWTDRLVDFVSESFKERHGSDPRDLPTSLQLLRNDCDQSKIALSEASKVSITCRHGGKALAVPVTREKFEELTADLLQRTIDTTELVLDTASVAASELDAIVLVGGSTLMPSVPRSLEQVLGMKPYQGLSPHTAVAQGAAIHAAILEAKFRGDDGDLGQVIKKRLEGVQQDNVNSHGLGVVIRDPKSGQPRNVVMIRRNTKLPAEVRQTFATHEENQNRASVKVVEGEAPDPAACSFIGKCTIHGLPAPLPKGSPIEVCYKFNASGRVEIMAKDKTGGKQAQIHLERGGGLNDAQVDGYAKLAAEYQVD
jgi:molecular chaperone DnaK